MPRPLIRHTWLLQTTLILLACFAGSKVQADDVTYSYTLTGADPTFNRTLAGNPPTGLSGVGTAVSYYLQPFYVNVSDSYTLETIAATLAPNTADDTFLILYQDAFNPATPLVNALQADDDAGAGSLSLISNRPLTAGTQYFLVTTTFNNGALGDITTRIANVTTGNTAVLGFVAVPEPATLAFAGAGLFAAGLGYQRWRATRKTKTQRRK